MHLFSLFHFQNNDTNHLWPIFGSPLLLLPIPRQGQFQTSPGWSTVRSRGCPLLQGGAVRASLPRRLPHLRSQRLQPGPAAALPALPARSSPGCCLPCPLLPSRAAPGCLPCLPSPAGRPQAGAKREGRPGQGKARREAQPWPRTQPCGQPGSGRV